MTTRRFRRLTGGFVLVATVLALGAAPRADTGYDLWLRYVPLTDAVARAAYRPSAAASSCRCGRRRAT